MNEEQINKIIHLMQTDDSVDAPEDAIRWSKNIFRSRVVEQKKSFAQKVLAILQMDISPDKAAFGERSTSASQARQMFFQAGENALDLRIVKTGKNFTLHGQILGEGFANGTIRLGEFESAANENSEFKFTKIPGGTYDLILQKGERQIAVENLELK